MSISRSSANDFKLNIKHMKLIRAVEQGVVAIKPDVECIKRLSEECYKETLIPGLDIVIKNATRVLNYSKSSTYVNCQVYLLNVDRLIDSIKEVEPKLTNGALDSESNLIDLKDAVHHIGAVFNELATAV